MRTWLKDIREAQHLSQAEISERVNITQPSYSNIEMGKRNPSVEAAKKIADILGFPWTRFYDDEQDIGQKAGSASLSRIFFCSCRFHG